MQRDTKRFAELYNTYLSNTASISEEEEFFSYIEDPLYKDRIEQLLSDSFEYQTDFIHLESQSRKRILDHILRKEPIKSPKPIYRKILSHVAIAASLILCLGGIFYLLYPEGRPDVLVQENKDPSADIVYLDSTQVYLTLANGRRIALSDDIEGKVAEESGVIITKSPDGRLIYEISDVATNTLAYNSIETPRGGQYQISLPDGTKVWLNAGSSLKYPVSFAASQERKVHLKGEGYFEVSPDRNKPFRVLTEDTQEVEVLGTHFNINAYNREIKTVLLEGSVRVTSMTGDRDRSVLLKPNQIVLNNGQRFVVKDLPYPANIIAWRDGYFVFNNANIKEIMTDLSNWYDLEVEYQGDMSSIYFHGNYLRSRDVLKLLKSLELTNKVKFEIKGRRVIVIAG